MILVKGIQKYINMTKKDRELLIKEILLEVPNNPKGRLLLSPRFGKTKLAIEIIKREKPKSILWVTPEVNLFNDVKKEFAKWSAKRYIDKISFTTWVSLPMCKGDFDIVVFDEEQFATENNLKSIFEGKVTYKSIISLTGTPTKHYTKLALYEQLGLEVYYKMDIEKAINLGILANYTIKVINVPLGTEKNFLAGGKNKKFYTTEKKNYEYIDQRTRQAIELRTANLKFEILNRLSCIKNSPSKYKVAEFLIQNLKGRKLFFCASIEQANKLCKYRFHSKTDEKDLKAFKEGEIDTIALVNAGGVGHTYKKVDNFVITQIDSDKNGLSTQKLCRSLLNQEDYEAQIWILNLKETQDSLWLQNFLSNFDNSKVEFMTFEKLKEDFRKEEIGLW